MPEFPTKEPVTASPDATLLLAASELVEQAHRRASGAPLVKGNAVRILKDGAANYTAWFAAIGAARKTVFFENYIIEDDEVGRELAAGLIDRARAGVKVRMLHDWLGSLAGATRRYWRVLVAAGVARSGDSIHLAWTALWAGSAGTIARPFRSMARWRSLPGSA